MRQRERMARISELQEFHAALCRLVDESDYEARSYSGPPTIVPRSGRSHQWAAARANVDRLAARAAHTLQAVNVGIAHKRPGEMVPVPVNPAATWATLLSDRPMFSVEDLEACINQAIGGLEAGLARSGGSGRASHDGNRHASNILVGVIVGVVSTVVGGLILWSLGVGR